MVVKTFTDELPPRWPQSLAIVSSKTVQIRDQVAIGLATELWSYDACISVSHNIFYFCAIFLVVVRAIPGMQGTQISCDIYDKHGNINSHDYWPVVHRFCCIYRFKWRQLWNLLSETRLEQQIYTLRTMRGQKVMSYGRWYNVKCRELPTKCTKSIGRQVAVSCDNRQRVQDFCK